VTLPRILRVKQTFDPVAVGDPAQEVAAGIDSICAEKNIQTGQSVALACSSRGIANYAQIVQAAVQSLQKNKLEPFIIPAMGSHGAATSAGQKRVLEHLGITEKKVGAPIRSSLEVIEIGKTEAGIPVFMDKLAATADHVVLVNRIKQHTEFEYEFESGLLKMMAIGLGKQEGAATYHEAMMTYGYPQVILTVAKKVMQHANILLGIATVENGYGKTAKIGVCPADRIEYMEKELFKLAKKLAPKLPFENADIIIIDEMGKDISGTGFDTKVVGRIGLPLLTKDPDKPNIKRILVCDLTEGSEGNAVGVGIADFITQRLLNKIDMPALNMNTITGACPEMGKIPLTLENDREALEIAIKSIGLIAPENLRIIRIKNTACLSELDFSEAYEEDIKRRSDLEIIENKRSMTFDPSGNLTPF
jgi:hypothetical protein